jgi:hypothetical protein
MNLGRMYLAGRPPARGLVRRAVSVACLSSILLDPAGVGSAHAQGVPPAPAGPPKYHQEKRPRSGLVIGGAITFGVTYALSAYVALDALLQSHAGESNWAPWLLVPAAGPFIAVGRVKSDFESVVFLVDDLLVADGLAQIAGLVMFTYGMASPVTLSVPDPPQQSRCFVVPLALGKGGAGLGVVGIF